MNYSQSNQRQISQAPTSTRFGDRTLAAWEIASVVSSVAIAEWMLTSAVGFNKAFSAVPVTLAVLQIVISHIVRNESPREIGFRLDNLPRALYLLAVPLAVIAIIWLIISWNFVTVDFLRWFRNRNPALQLSFSFLWALTQQYVLQGYLNRRAMIVLGRGWASVLLIAAVFALLHLPNPWITLITFVAGTIWATVYQRTPNLFALAITHSVMTWFIVSTLPAWMLGHLRVGLGYFG